MRLNEMGEQRGAEPDVTAFLNVTVLRSNPTRSRRTRPYREPLGVMTSGRWFPRAELERMLSATKTRMVNRRASTPDVVPVALTLDEFEQFVGRFFSDAAGDTIVTELREGVLWIQIPEYPTMFALEPIDTVTFSRNRSTGAH